MLEKNGVEVRGFKQIKNFKLKNFIFIFFFNLFCF